MCMREGHRLTQDEFLYGSLLYSVAGSLLLSYCCDKTLLPIQLINESLIGVMVLESMVGCWTNGWEGIHKQEAEHTLGFVVALKPKSLLLPLWPLWSPPPSTGTHLLILPQDLSLNLGYGPFWLDWLASRTRIYLSPLPSLTSSRVTDNRTGLAFMWVLESWTQVLKFAQWVFYTLRHLPDL